MKKTNIIVNLGILLGLSLVGYVAFNEFNSRAGRAKISQNEGQPKVWVDTTTTTIDNVEYKATLTDRDMDGIHDALKIERKSTSYDWRTFKGTKEEYFVTSLPRSPFIRSGTIVNVVKPEFFSQYEKIFTPNRDYVTSTYGGQ